MNTIEKLLLTKQELEAEFEKERQARIINEQKAQNEKIKLAAIEKEKMMDGIRYSQCKEIYDRLITIIGKKEIDPEYVLYMVSALIHLGRNAINTREYFETMESITRYLNTQEKSG